VIMKENKLNEINILPYHSIANEKYKRLAMDNRLPDLREPSQEEINTVVKYFTTLGLDTKVGG